MSRKKGSGDSGGTGEPMLAVLSDRRDFDKNWIFERKLDGVRALARRDGERIRLSSRTHQPLDATYPEIVDAPAAQPHDSFEVDGEIVAMESGRTSFARLQRRMQLTDPKSARASGVRVDFYLFDLLRLDGHDTTALPLRDRKRLLRRAPAGLLRGGPAAVRGPGRHGLRQCDPATAARRAGRS